VTYTYDVAVDWDYLGSGAASFVGTHDDISAYVISCSGQMGINKEQANVADVGKCTLTLRNDDRRFSPKNAASPLYGKLLVGKPVRVRVTDGTTDTFFLGKIKSINPHSGGQATASNGVMSDRLCEIQCADVMDELSKAKLAAPVMTQRYAHELVQTVINKGLNAPYATATLTFTGNPANNDTASFTQTINGVSYGGTYTYKTVLGSAANEVLIGATREASLENLCAAINGAAGAGTTYTNATRPLGIVTAAPQGYRYVVLEDDPIRYHMMGEPSGTNADDIGANGMDATLQNGAAFGASALTLSDTAVTLDGTNDLISEPTIDFGNRSFSIGMWIRPGATPPANQDLWSIYDSFTANKLIYLRLTSTGQLTLDFYLTGGNIQTATGVIAFPATYYVMVTYDYTSLTAKIIVGGVEQASGTCGPYTGSPLPTIQIGAFTAAGTNFKGIVGHWALFWKPLSAVRIAAHVGAQLLDTGIALTATLPGTVGNGIAIATSSSAFSSGTVFFAGGIDYPTDPANSFESTDTLIPFAGDDWQSDDTNALTALTAVVKTEGTALFWAQRDGSLEFKNRGYQFRRGAAAATLTLSSQHQDAAAELSDESVYNGIEVNIRPRRLKAVGVVGKINAPVMIPGRSGKDRWKSNTPITAAAGTDGLKVVKVQFTDPDTGIRCAAQNVVLPLLATTHYTLNEKSDGTGVEYTNGDPATGILYVFFSAVVSASNIEVSIRNGALGDLYLRKLEIEAEALVKYEPITAVAEDAASQLAYGKRTLSVQLPLSGDQPFAEAYAKYLLGRYKEPEFRVKKLSFNNINDVGGVKLHKLPFGTVVSYTDYQHAESAAKYMLRGVSWNFGSPKSGRMSQTFDVFKLDDFPYAVFDGGTPRGKFDQSVFGL